MTQENDFGALNGGLLDREYLIDNAEQGIECALNGVAPIDSDVSVQDFLQHFSVANQARSLADELLQQTLRISLMWMRRAHQVHRYIGIDKNHLRSATP